MPSIPDGLLAQLIVLEVGDKLNSLIDIHYALGEVVVLVMEFPHLWEYYPPQVEVKMRHHEIRGFFVQQGVVPT